MLNALEFFRIHLAGSPLLLWIAGLATLLMGRTREALGESTPAWTAQARRLTCVAGLAGLCVYSAVAIWYALELHFVDNAEPTMTAIGWLFHVGQPLYPSPDSESQYAHIYGPVAYIAHGYALAAFGADIRVSKGLGAGAGIASLAFLYGAIRPHGSRVRAASLTGLCALLLLSFRQYSFWTRPDPLQVLSVSAALFVATSGTGYLRAVLVGIISGLLWNLKFTGPLYSLPTLAIVHARMGRTAILTAVAVAVVVSAAPFAFFPNVSLSDYLTWLRLSAQTGVLLSILRQNLAWAFYLVVPLLLSYYALPRDQRPRGRDWRDAVVGLFLGICGIVLAAAKPGAGPYHLMPFFPVIIFIISWQLSHLATVMEPLVPRAAVAFLLVACLIALAQQVQLVTIMRSKGSLSEAQDILAFADTHEGRAEMGYGQTESLALARPILVFRNNAYLIDQPAVREHQLAGLEVPRATVAAVLNCRVKYWLVPKGEAPFSGVNGYSKVLLRPLYGLEFRHAFDTAYQRVGVTSYYDVWQCRSEASR